MCGGDIEDIILIYIIAEFHHGFEAYLYQNTKIVDKLEEHSTLFLI